MKYAYGNPPAVLCDLDLDFTEFMHYLYLPVVMPGVDAGEVLQHGYIRLPPNLEFLREFVEMVCDAAHVIDDDSGDVHQYVYVTARHGYASPGNPLNRPGWHADGFGSDDLNFVWASCYPTRYAVGPIHECFGGISDDHHISAIQFDAICEHPLVYGVDIFEGEPNTIYRLDPSVVHSVPEIPPPGGQRSFVKVSISPNRYNLLGNSHNHLFNYDWKMWSREEIRNDPSFSGGDAGPQT